MFEQITFQFPDLPPLPEHKIIPRIPYYEISEETARRAHEMNSMQDYPANGATNEYRTAVDEAAALVAAQKKRVSPYYHDKLDSLLDRYARRLAEWTNAYNRNRASCPSVLVSGAGNFPTGKKHKQNAREDSLMAEYKEIESILDKIKSVGTGPVDLTDPHAREILSDKLAQAQKALDYAKAGNAYFRKHKNLRGYAGLSDTEADAMTDPEGFTMRVHGKPFPDYELTSIRNKIKRLESRIAELDKLQAEQENPADNTKFDGGEIVRNAEQNRLQIVFDDKPDEDTRKALKSHGFRWSPKNNAWQRQLTRSAEYDARHILGLK